MDVPRVEGLNLVVFIGLGDAGLQIRVEYIPIVAGMRLKDLQGALTIQQDRDVGIVPSGQESDVLTRAQQLFDLLGVLAPTHKLEIEGHHAEVPEELVCLWLRVDDVPPTVLMHCGSAASSMLNPRQFGFHELPEGQVRLIQSLTTTLRA